MIRNLLVMVVAVMVVVPAALTMGCQPNPTPSAGTTQPQSPAGGGNPTAPIPSAMSETLSITVEGMSCRHCEEMVANAAASVPGVRVLECSAAKNLLVIQAPAETREKVIRAIRSQTGYEVP